MSNEVTPQQQSAIVRGATRDEKIAKALEGRDVLTGYTARADDKGTLYHFELSGNGIALRELYVSRGVSPEPDEPVITTQTERPKRKRNTLTARQRQAIVGGYTHDRDLADSLVELRLATSHKPSFHDAGKSVVYERFELTGMTPDALVLRERYIAVREQPEPVPKPGDPKIIGSRAIVVQQPIAACVATGRCPVIVVPPKIADVARAKLVGRRVGIIEGRGKRPRAGKTGPDGEPWLEAKAPGCVIATVRIVGIMTALEKGGDPWRNEGECAVFVADPVVLGRPVKYPHGPGWLRLDRKPRDNDKYAKANADVRRQEAEALK